MPNPATLMQLKVNDDDWSGVYLSARLIAGNIMPAMPDGKLLRGVCSCTVNSSTDGITTMTITVELQNGQ